MVEGGELRVRDGLVDTCAFFFFFSVLYIYCAKLKLFLFFKIILVLVSVIYKNFTIWQ